MVRRKGTPDPYYRNLTFLFVFFTDEQGKVGKRTGEKKKTETFLLDNKKYEVQ